jgi:hypothetical protein
MASFLLHNSNQGAMNPIGNRYATTLKRKNIQYGRFMQ